MPTIFAIFVLALFASARLNRLAARDMITAPLRVTLSSHTNWVSRFLSALLSCTWCVGIWTGFACAAYAHWITSVTWQVLPFTGLMIAWGAPILAYWLDPEPHPDWEPTGEPDVVSIPIPDTAKD